MGKSPVRRVFTLVSSSSVLSYRRKISEPADNQQLEQQPAAMEQQQQQNHLDHKKYQPTLQSQPHPPSISSTNNHQGTERKMQFTRRMPHNPKRPQRAVVKQRRWKPKITQPVLLPQRSWNKSGKEVDDEEEDEETTFFKAQRRTQKLLASAADGKIKNAIVTKVTTSEIFLAETSSQETQSGSEDENLFMPYSNLSTFVRSPAQLHGVKQQETTAVQMEQKEVIKQIRPVKAIARRTEAQEARNSGQPLIWWNQCQKVKRQQKQKLVAAKDQKRPLREQRQLHMDLNTHSYDVVDANEGNSLNEDIVELNKIVPYIVVGNVACPIATNGQRPMRAGMAEKGKAVDMIMEDFCQHLIQKTQMRYRDSFVVEDSGFDAASSYDFFNSRFTEIQNSTSIVYF
ncbi:uncharacterized protein PHALS_13355 [Plasmopara halstedii]|uniref:Uncharacterized protein n=1 Tax=Plasmopara halstedii TaxID=4781 RepID=A0A0N7L631_PLAHL|nr:uncharacterized protein PHALS_13355 [Plasmopara halstedii]CEG43139.1 hypothetical protein PHALS_13355 [Plasmopara halstedii]|eukprot:XP_024579508.1 hypothetical protein PHALS_13355 [Plasmopara halstedii]